MNDSIKNRIEKYVRILPIPVKVEYDNNYLILKTGTIVSKIPITDDIHENEYSEIIKMIYNPLLPIISLRVNNAIKTFNIKKLYLKKDLIIIEDVNDRVRYSYMCTIPVSEFIKNIRKLDLVQASKYFVDYARKIQKIDASYYTPDFKGYTEKQIRNFVMINILKFDTLKLNDTSPKSIITYLEEFKNIKTEKEIFKKIGIIRN